LSFGIKYGLKEWGIEDLNKEKGGEYWPYPPPGKKLG
jgi:hypothetical protein